MHPQSVSWRSNQEWRSVYADTVLKVNILCKNETFNFQGGYAGNAAGMKISSLHKLTDIRSNKPGLTMLHYVASLAEKSNSELLTIPEDLAILEEASKTSLEQLSIEVTQLDNQIKKIANQMKQAQEDVKKQMSEFLDYASGVR